MNIIITAITSFVLGGLVILLTKWLIGRKKRKTEKEKKDYKPKGRIGYYRIQSNDCYAVMIVEEIDRIEQLTPQKKSRVKIKILEVSIDRDCDKSVDDCLKAWGKCNWVTPSSFVWHEKTAAEVREEKLNGILGEDESN